MDTSSFITLAFKRIKGLFIGERPPTLMAATGMGGDQPASPGRRERPQRRTLEEDAPSYLTGEDLTTGLASIRSHSLVPAKA